MAINNREILGKGLKFPFRIGGDSLSHDGPEQSKYERHVIEGMQQLVLTLQKSRRGNRAFGGRFFELTFEMLTRSPGLATEFIKDVMEQEKRVVLLGVESYVIEGKNLVEVRIDIQFLNSSARANLVFPFYESETGAPALMETRITLS